MMKAIIEAAKSFFGKLLGDELTKPLYDSKWLNQPKAKGSVLDVKQEAETPKTRNFNDLDIANLEHNLSKLEAIDKIGVLALQSEFAKCIDGSKASGSSKKKAKAASKKATKKPVKKSTKKQPKKSKKTAKKI